MKAIRQPPVSLVAALLITLLGITACQKKIDNTIPSEANTLSDDVQNTYNILSGGEVWYWDLPTASFDFNLFVGFNRDSTSVIYTLKNYTLVDQLSLLYSSGQLTSGDSITAISLVSDFGGIDDDWLREVLEDPIFISYKNRLLTLLPNYANINGKQIDERDSATYKVGGPVQLSLTFNNSKFLPQLKVEKKLDFDFRIFSFSKDSVSLVGYYNSNANKQSALRAIKAQSPKEALNNYVNGSGLLLLSCPTKATVSLRVDGVLLPTPDGYNSGIDFFYRSFADNVLDRQTYQYSYVPLPNIDNMPEALSNITSCVITGYYDGNFNHVPSGTVVLTMTAYASDGTRKSLEFVKD